MIRWIALLALLAGPAAALDIGGVDFPDQRVVQGTTLVRNGAGLRLYSVLRIRVYAAGLYLERASASPEAILAAPGRKLLEVHALRAVDQADVQDAWRKTLDANCVAPCRLPADAAAFVAAAPAVKAGDVVTYAVGPQGLQVQLNNRPIGTYGTEFGRLLLGTFLGPAPPTEALKQALLGR